MGRFQAGVAFLCGLALCSCFFSRSQLLTSLPLLLNSCRLHCPLLLTSLPPTYFPYHSYLLHCPLLLTSLPLLFSSLSTPAYSSLPPPAFFTALSCLPHFSSPAYCFTVPSFLLHYPVLLTSLPCPAYFTTLSYLLFCPLLFTSLPLLLTLLPQLLTSLPQFSYFTAPNCLLHCPLLLTSLPPRHCRAHHIYAHRRHLPHCARRVQEVVRLLPG